MSRGVTVVAERALKVLLLLLFLLVFCLFVFFWGGEGESETRMTASVLKQDPKLF